MKQKIKKVFENAVWWSGVIAVGIVLGISLQIVKAWTEPTTAPPGGNVGAPINTSDVPQSKWGALQVLGFTLFNDADLNDDGITDNDVTGKVLTAQNANGATAWAAGGGGGGSCYTNFGGLGCASGYAPILEGYITIYYTYISGVAGSGSAECSSIKYDDIVSTGISVFASSAGGKYEPLENARCVICCK